MAEKYKIGDIIKCQVTGIENYGIFVSVDSVYSGLIHISEISNDFVRNVHDFAQIGEEIYCQILDIDDKNYQLKLSIKNINYKSDDDNKIIKETRKGFLPLKENLSNWICEKLKYYKK